MLIFGRTAPARAHSTGGGVFGGKWPTTNIARSSSGSLRTACAFATTFGAVSLSRQCAARLAAALALFTAITNAWKNVKPMRATITPNGRRGSQVLRRLIIDRTPLRAKPTMEQTSGLRQMPS
jgi:hypothetical protein